MFDQNYLISTTYTATGAQTGVVLLTIDTANGNAQANPIVENSGPGLKDGCSTIRVLFDTVSGTAPTVIPYNVHSDDGTTYYRYADPIDMNGPATTVGMCNIRATTRKRYVQTRADFTGTSYLVTLSGGLTVGDGG